MIQCGTNLWRGKQNTKVLVTTPFVVKLMRKLVVSPALQRDLHKVQQLQQRTERPLPTHGWVTWQHCQQWLLSSMLTFYLQRWRVQGLRKENKLFYTKQCLPTAAWWRHQLETFSVSLAICVGNSPSTVNSHHKVQRCGALMFFFDLRLNEWLSKQS